MKTRRYLSVAAVLLLAVIATSLTATFADTEQSGGSVLKPAVYAATPKNVSADVPRRAESIAIYMDGSDRLHTKIVEDALALELMTRGFTVIERNRLEALLAANLQEIQESGGDTQALSPTQVAKQAGAEMVILGNLVSAQRAISTNDESGKPISVARRTVCSLLSLRMIDAKDNTCLKIVVAEGLEGNSTMEAVRIVLGDLKKLD